MISYFIFVRAIGRAVGRDIDNISSRVAATLNPLSIAAVSLIVLALSSCTTLPESLEIQASKNASRQCRDLVRDIPSTDAIATLDRFSDLVAAQCHREAITLGRWIRDHYREKNYSVARETASILIPEDVMTEYVLESYERAYLSFMLALEEMEIGHTDDAKVELRRDYREGKAFIYNFGDDPVNAMLVAALWESLDEPSTARSFWKRAGELNKDGSGLQIFAERQIERIDRGEIVHWHAVPTGQMPELDWASKLSAETGPSFYRVTPTKALPTTCTSDTGALITTSPWIDKISLRHNADYHPFLNAKTWVRLPIGILYGITTFSAGTAIAVGGCTAGIGIGSKIGDNRGAGEVAGGICRASLEVGVALASQASDVTSFAIRPDLRHWKKVPAAFLLTTKDEIREDSCSSQASFLDKSLSNTEAQALSPKEPFL